MKSSSRIDRRALFFQAAEEVRMTIERGETFLVTFGIPIVFLIFFTKVNVLPTGTTKRVEFIAPGIFCLAVMSTAMVASAIATAFERNYGVLRRVGLTPLGARGIIAAKIAGVIAIESLQCLVIGGVSLALGWQLHGGVGQAIAAIALATVAFGGIGLVMAGALRAELTLALANALYVAFVLIGGVIFPLAKLGALGTVSRLLPITALSDILHPAIGVGGTVPLQAWVVLAIWAVLTPIAAVKAFSVD